MTWLGLLDVQNQWFPLSLAALLLAFLSASQDIVIDAVRIETVSPEDQGIAAAAALAGYRFGMLLTGAGAIWLALHFGWPVAYIASAAIPLVGLTSIFGVHEPSGEHAGKNSTGPSGEPVGIFRTFVDPIADLFNRKGMLVILFFALTYKVNDAVLLTLVNPFLLHVGFSLGDVAELANPVGILATIAGGIAGGRLIRRFNLFHILILAGIFQTAGLWLYSILAVVPHSPLLLVAIVGFEGLFGGAAWAALVTFLSDLCRSPLYTATQYAVLTALMAFGRSLLAAPSGYVVDFLGWGGMFLVYGMVGLLPLIALMKWRPLG